MAERGAFTPLHPIARKYVARIEGELPAKLRELVERLHEAEPIRDARERGTQRRAQRKKCARAHH